ncbi:hypothetical protein BU16DRAFT_75751 [Lophium mytilinum]|uniref:Heterokaryon incompatibility domain-containing protein n=1 Tax=Lophium mytilinum TaxID=390894 RepID=A0A6A6QMH4_9PEZI|nr:hypothetical protein BU16DRAFT_75751 [Lophium mytilinum]
MDHLPLPSSPSLNHEIPYLCTENFDGGPFATYDTRSGWTWSSVAGQIQFKRNGKTANNEQIASFLQTWLYFGLLSETLGEWSPGLHKRFIAEGKSGQKRLSTQYLEQTVVDWSGLLAEIPLGMSWKSRLLLYSRQITRALKKLLRLLGLPMQPDTRREDLEKDLDRFRACLQTTQSLIFHFYRHRKRYHDSEVYQLLALMELAMFLTLTWNNIYSHVTGKLPEGLLALQNGKSITNVFLTKHMRKKNWCPSDIARIMGDSPSSTIWYYANMTPPRKKLDHKGCSEVFCKRTQIDMNENYQLSHTGPGCNCQLVYADFKQLKGILNYGDIPVLKRERDSSIDQSKVTALSSSNNPYVAISHIWAEGLGDPYDNALHECEVARLFTLIEQIPVPEIETTCLWIDTMCVPVGRKHPDLNKLAMNKMKDTYVSAAAVLVLDRYVQEFEAKQSPLEAFARVANSSWMQRLWTLQEGRLSKQVWFQFADGPILLVDIFNCIPRSRFPASGANVVNVNITMSYRASKLHRIAEEELIFKPLYEGLFATRTAVMSRAVSWHSDEALCLAFLMDLDIEHIIHTEDDRKMEAFWELLPILPLSLVFSKAPKKLAKPGFRWAPSTFLGPIPGTLHDSWAGPNQLWKRLEAKPTRFGLLINLPGVLIQPKRSRSGWSIGLQLGTKYTFQTGDDKWFAISLAGPWSKLTTGSRPEESSETIAIILQDILPPPNVLLNAVVGKITQEHDNEYHVEVLQHAEVMQLDPGFSLMYTTAAQCAQALWKDHDPDTERLFMKSNENKLSPDIKQKCIAQAKEALLRPDLLDVCREKRRLAGVVNDTDEEVTFMLAGITHQVFVEGFNYAETRGAHQRWYID